MVKYAKGSHSQFTDDNIFSNNFRTMENGLVDAWIARVWVVINLDFPHIDNDFEL